MGTSISGKLANPLAGRPTSPFDTPTPTPTGSPATNSGTGGTGTQIYAPSTNPAEAVMHGSPAPAGSHLARLAAGNSMIRGVADNAAGIGAGVRSAVQSIRTTVKGDVAAGHLGQIGEDVRAGLQGLRTAVMGAHPNGPDPTFHPNPNPGPNGPPSADRVARLTARKGKIDAAAATFAGGTGTTENKARVAAFAQRADARIGARIAGTPYTRPTTPLPAKTAGTTPIRDVRASAGLKVRPRAPRA